ncbi:MAG: twin-arginine translocase TatA/TatE family subunit [Solirubrobacterales bacterium]
MFGIIGNVGPWELVLILAIVLIIFGAGKLPGVGKSIGQAIGEFRQARVDEPTDAKSLPKDNKAE